VDVQLQYKIFVRIVVINAMLVFDWLKMGNERTYDVEV